MPQPVQVSVLEWARDQARERALGPEQEPVWVLASVAGLTLVLSRKQEAKCAAR